jgi:hypothetical protein
LGFAGVAPTAKIPSSQASPENPKSIKEIKKGSPEAPSKPVGSTGSRLSGHLLYQILKAKSVPPTTAMFTRADKTIDQILGLTGRRRERIHPRIQKVNAAAINRMPKV